MSASPSIRTGDANERLVDSVAEIVVAYRHASIHGSLSDVLMLVAGNGNVMKKTGPKYCVIRNCVLRRLFVLRKRMPTLIYLLMVGLIVNTMSTINFHRLIKQKSRLVKNQPARLTLLYLVSYHQYTDAQGKSPALELKW